MTDERNEVDIVGSRPPGRTEPPSNQGGRETREDKNRTEDPPRTVTRREEKIGSWLNRDDR
jgi:hypothetical protein